MTLSFAVALPIEKIQEFGSDTPLGKALNTPWNLRDPLTPPISCRVFVKMTLYRHEANSSDSRNESDLFESNPTGNLKHSVRGISHVYHYIRQRLVNASTVGMAAVDSYSLARKLAGNTQDFLPQGHVHVIGQVLGIPEGRSSKWRNVSGQNEVLAVFER